MRAPLTLAEAMAQGITAPGAGIYTFPNHSAWERWASRNCDRCRHYLPDATDDACAFEGAAVSDCVSPALATRYGWLQDPQYDRPDDHRDGWQAPERCACFAEEGDDDNDPPIPPDPRQLVLLADPTEDAAMFDVVAADPPCLVLRHEHTHA